VIRPVRSPSTPKRYGRRLDPADTWVADQQTVDWGNAPSGIRVPDEGPVLAHGGMGAFLTETSRIGFMASRRHPKMPEETLTPPSGPTPGGICPNHERKDAASGMDLEQNPRSEPPTLTCMAPDFRSMRFLWWRAIGPGL
jgi:hypothetical protein